MYRTLRRMNIQEVCRLKNGEPHVLPAAHFPSPRGQSQLSRNNSPKHRWLLTDTAVIYTC